MSSLERIFGKQVRIGAIEFSRPRAISIHRKWVTTLRTVEAPLARIERVFRRASWIAVLDCAYVTWRYLALHSRSVERGTGLCSLYRGVFLIFPRGVDCDPVLLSPQARAFYVPNATLGLGFFLGCALFWERCRSTPQRGAAIALLRLWMPIATLFTLRFFSLLVFLPTLCPVCPWNHLLTWTMTWAMWRLGRDEPTPSLSVALRSLRGPIALGVSTFVIAQILWVIPWTLGLLTP